MYSEYQQCNNYEQLLTLDSMIFVKYRYTIKLITKVWWYYKLRRMEEGNV